MSDEITWCPECGNKFQHCTCEKRRVSDRPLCSGSLDALRDAIIVAVEWIEDDRFGDDYIMEDWYHQMKSILEGFRNGRRRNDIL